MRPCGAGRPVKPSDVMSLDTHVRGLDRTVGPVLADLICSQT